MEEYSEAKTYKGKSELRNSKILTIFIHQSGNNNYCEHGICLRKTRDNMRVQMLQVLSDVSWYMCFQLRILDVTEVFVSQKYCPLCLNIASKSETEMFSMNNQRQVQNRHATCHQRSSNRSSPAGGETSLANHSAKKSNNPQNNSGLCHYIISELQPFT